MRKKFKILALSMISGFSVLAFATSSIAWFASGFHVTFGTDASNVNVFGGSDASYYKSGSGTEQDPYVIGNKIHLYNLAWLQYIGYYNKRSTVATGSPVDLEQCYFVLDEDIDMGGLTIPPIGTNKYPFLGNFDGQGYTISNFTISNDDPEPDSSDFGVAKPSNRYQGEQPDIVGFFGVMGKLPNQTITEDYDSTIVGASNVVLENFKVVSKTSQVLIGLAGGYVNGDLSGVKVGDNAKIDVNGQVSTAKTNITSNLSDYGLVGYSTRLDNSGGTYNQKLSKMDANYDTSQPEGGGQGNEWGGSFNSKEYNKWFYDLGTSGELFNTNLNRNGYSSNGYNQKTVTGSGGYAINFSTSGTSNPQTNHIVNRLREGSYLPLSFSDETKSHASMSNTGYLVGSNLSGVNASPKISSYKMVNIGNAISNTAYENMSTTSSSSTANIPYDNSKLEILTYQGGWKRIKDTYNANNNSSNSQIRSYTKTDLSTFGFQKYETSRAVLGEILSEGTMIHGIHFDNNTVSATNLFTIPANTARVNGTAYTTTYQVPKGSINFSLKEKGLINFFAGTYNTSNIDLNFFSLNEVKRNGGNISSIKEITQIYVNTAESGGYVYKYSDNTYSTGTRGNLVFDVATVLKAAAPVVNMMYYFEIPVNAGEYAMGIASGATQGAYMIYLDIGASGETKDHVDAHYITTTKSGVAHPIGVDFDVNGSGNNGGDSFGFIIADSDRGTIKVEISTTTNTNDTVSVTQTSLDVDYSYLKTNYSNNFSISGMSGAPPSGNSEKIRVLTINLKIVGGSRYNIVITETLDGSDNVTESVYSVNGETTASYDTDAEIEALSGEITDIDIFRQLPVAATLTRSYGTAEFYTEYNITKCTDTVVDVTIALNSTRITAAITNGYTLKVNDATISNGQSIT